MNCGFPIELHGRFRPCGKCEGCRRRRRNAWVGRMLLEQSQHKESAFVTLTYEDPDLPLIYHPEHDIWIPTLVKSHVQKWIRSVRQKATHLGRTLRYFAAGEYGSESGRPHYHLILFGIGPTWNPIFKDSWNKGFVSSYEATARTMAYVAKYVMKQGNDPELSLPEYGEYSLENPRITTPPFRLTSRRPALGTTYAKNIASSLVRDTGHGLLYDPSEVGPVNRIKISGKTYPLDKTMKAHLENALVKRGVNHYQVSAMLNRDDWEPSHEEIIKAREGCYKARRQTHKKTKL